MKEMYFSVPYGTHEMSFGIANEGDDLWNFYLIFVESTIMDSRQVIAYGDYKEDGILVEMQSGICDWDDDHGNEIELEFDISETEKMKICVFMDDDYYTVHVNY